MLRWEDWLADRAGITGKELPNTPRAQKGGPDWDTLRELGDWGGMLKGIWALAFPQMVDINRT